MTALLIGHLGLWLWIFNRVNATGLDRITIKRLEKTIVAICVALPIGLLAWEYRRGHAGYSGQELWDLLFASDPWQQMSFLTLGYVAFVVVFTLLVGPLWLAHRPQFAVAKDRYHVLSQARRNAMHRDHPEWVTGAMTRAFLRVPGNEILSIESNRKRLHLENIDPAWNGMCIGHLSDIHLTDQLSPKFARYCVDWVIDQGIELLVVSGDLVDQQHGVEMLPHVFGDLPNALQKIFVLGNHDKAHDLVEPARDAMLDLGWIDAGASHWTLETNRGPMRILGNELPWLDRHDDESLDSEFAQQAHGRQPSTRFVLGVSHSPDQMLWARRSGCQLLLCGHTHGGQVRLPGIGPIVAPSKHGSRYASGVFYGAPTVMHVSRGVSGTHPLRWRCSPEASVLEIASEPFDSFSRTEE